MEPMYYWQVSELGNIVFTFMYIVLPGNLPPLYSNGKSQHCYILENIGFILFAVWGFGSLIIKPL
jgi:hypothetical protein